MSPQANSSSTGRATGVLLVLLSVLLGLLLVAAGVYAGIAKRYESMFLPNTTVNGIDVSGMNLSQVERALSDHQGEYSLTLIERDGVTETITGESIDFTLAFDNSLSDALAEQNNWAWPLALWGGQSGSITVDTMFSYDTGKLTEAITNLRCMNASGSTPPKDAYVSGFDPSVGGVQVVPEVQGNLVKQDILLPAIQRAVTSMQTELDLETLDCYEKPQITADDPALQARVDRLNQYLGIEITYHFGEDTVVLNGQQLQDWLVFNQDGTATVSEEKVTAFVRSLAYNYNTFKAVHTFTTSTGEEITLEEGDYGWWMNEPEEVQALMTMIENRESGTREPIWRQEAAVLGAGAAGDYGRTYVEINLTAQHLYFYKDGMLVLESDFVSGKNDGTPTGIYSITYKERYATLKGENYASPVSYWMPFSGNVGLHDAPWRTNFGGNLYVSGGSHGCVNLPIETARTLYENLPETAAVVVYKLPGTERSETSSQSYDQIASAIVSALNEINGTTINSGNYNVMKKRINWAQAAYNHLSESAKAKVTNYSLLVKAMEDLAAYES